MTRLTEYAPRGGSTCAWLVSDNLGSFSGCLKIEKRANGKRFFLFSDFKDGRTHDLEAADGSPNQHISLIPLCEAIIIGKKNLTRRAIAKPSTGIDFTQFDGFIKPSANEFDLITPNTSPLDAVLTEFLQDIGGS